MQKDNILKETRTQQSIAIMLDSHGTSDMIRETSAEIFINLIDILRKQFGGQKAYIVFHRIIKKLNK